MFGCVFFPCEVALENNNIMDRIVPERLLNDHLGFFCVARGAAKLPADR